MRNELWLKTSVRITDLAVAPDLSRLVVVGLEPLPLPAAKPATDGQVAAGSSQQQPMPSVAEYRLIIYDFSTRVQEACVPVPGSFLSLWRLIYHIVSIL